MPMDKNVKMANDPVDLLLLSGLAFDKSGRRLGRGGGYYDAFLSSYLELARARSWKQPLLVALSYSVQIMDEEVIPVTATNVPIDALIHPSCAIPFSNAALKSLADNSPCQYNGQRDIVFIIQHLFRLKCWFALYVLGTYEAK